MQSSEKNQLYHFAEFLSNIFGSSYHFSFYDVEELAMRRATFSVGDISLQQSIACTELVRKAVREDDVHNDYKLSISSEDGGYRHNLFFLKREDGSLRGVFVVSDNVGAKTQLLSEIEAMLNVKTETVSPPAAQDAGLMGVSISSLPRLVRSLLEEQNIKASDNLTPEQKIKLIQELRMRGAFKLKGSVPIIAQLLNTSSPTVYRYLSKLDYQETTSTEIYRESIRLL